MTGLSDYTAKNLLNWSTGGIAEPALPAVFLALMTAVDTDAGTGGTEVSGGSYARLQVAGTLATNGTTTTASAVLNFAATVPSWIVAGMLARDVTTPSAITGGQTVLSTTTTSVTLSGNVNATVGSGDTIAFTAFSAATGSAPSTIANNATLTFPTATANWGTVIAWELRDALTSGNLLWWDYLGAFAWLPATVSSASPGVITAHAHGYANGNTFVFSNEYGGTAPTFSAGNYTGLLTVAGITTDTFNVTGVNTSATGNGAVRQVTQQSIPSGVTASFAGATITLTSA